MTRVRLTVAMIIAGLAVTISGQIVPLSDALAQPSPAKLAKAEAFFKKGESQYNLGNWQEAIDLYKRAYEEVPIPDLLFNIGQAYRLWENCKQSVFFYKRYLANKPDASNRAEVEDFIADQMTTCKNKEKEPTSTIEPKGAGTVRDPAATTNHNDGGGNPGTTDTAANGDDDDDDDDTATVATHSNRGDDDDDDDDIQVSSPLEDPQGPHLISASVGVGTSFVSFGDPMLNTDPLLALALGAGYPLHFNDMGIELGALVTYTPVPWKNSEGMTGTASLTGLMANAGALYAIPSIPQLSVRGDVGLGVQLFGGLTQKGTPFLEPNENLDAALTSFHLRIALGAEYLVTPNIAVSATPLIFAYSPKGVLRDTISGITRFELILGVGYKM